MLYGDGNVITCPGIVMWDSVTKAEEKKGDDGKVFQQWSLKVALLKTAPEVMEIDSILKAELANGQFRGKFPAGGHWGIVEINPQDLEGRLPSHVAINPKSYRLPQVFDLNRQEIPPLAYANMLYPGATVIVLVSARSYNNVSKGVGLWLQGIQIVDATTPRLPVGNGVNAADAFAAMPGGTAGPAGFPGAVPGAAAGYGPGAAAGPGAGYGPAAGVPGPGVPGIPAAPAPTAAALVMTAKAAGATYEQFMASGQWTDELLISQGYATRPVAAAPAGVPGPGVPGIPVAPNPGFLAGPGGVPGVPGVPAAPAAPAHVMTALAAGATYEQFMASGQWTDALLIQHGYMLP